MDPSKQPQRGTAPPRKDQEESKQQPGTSSKDIVGYGQVVKEARQSGQDDFIALQDQEGYASPLRPTA